MIKLFIKNLWQWLERKLAFKYYKSIDFLVLFNFFKIIETNDYRYLLKLSDYETLPDISNKLERKLKGVWLDIQNQYSKADDSNYQVINFTQSKSLQKMQMEYLMLWDLHTLMTIDTEGKEIKKRLKQAGLEKATIKTLEKKLKSLRNNIKIKCKDLEKKETTKPIDYNQIIDEIEDIKGRSLDIMKVTVKQYIAIRKNIKRKNGKRQNNSKRRNR